MIRKIGDTSVTYKYTSRYVLKAGQTVTVSEFSYHLTSLSQLTVKVMRVVIVLKVKELTSEFFLFYLLWET